MSKLSEIYNAYVSEMKSILETSGLLLQKKSNSLSGELHTSGRMCENFVKKFLTSHVPGHLRVTSGYIVDKDKKANDENLPQFDIIVANNMIGPIYKFSNADLEVVPVESVCAVIEIKRHLSKSEIGKHVSKLSQSVLKYDALKKNSKFASNYINPANMASNAISHPLVGLISLSHDLDDSDVYLDKQENILDFVWSIDGYLEMPTQSRRNGSGINVFQYTARPVNKNISAIQLSEWHAFLGDTDILDVTMRKMVDKTHPEKIMIKIIGWLMHILFRSKGQIGGDITQIINDYYLI